MTLSYYASEVSEILTKHEAYLGLLRIATDIVARVDCAENLAIVGIRRGGLPIAERIADHIAEVANVRVPLGSVDITLYRDDTPVPFPNPRIGRSDIPFDVHTKTVVLVDDVLHTGRTVRAAMHALLDFGRSRAIRLAVLIDRGGRELPIQPDHCVKSAVVAQEQQVEVFADNNEFYAMISDRKLRTPFQHNHDTTRAL